MPQLSRSDMHIMLDVALEVLQGSQFNRLDSPIKDIWLNATIDDFIKETIDSANKPNPSKRLPAGVVTYNDIISKYNDIRTLISTKELTNGSSERYIAISSISGNGTIVTINTINYHALQTGDKVIVTNISGGSGIWNGTFTIIKVTDNQFTFSSTGVGTPSFTNTSIAYEFVRDYQAFVLPSNLYHFESSSSLVTPLTCSIANVISNVLLTTYDIASYNDNPFGGGGKNMATSIIGEELRIYNLNRYNILKINLLFIKTPAKLTSSPQVVNCDLPANVHTKIVELTARKIAAFNNNDNFQPIATEINTPIQ